jgi:cytidylate kinase
MTSNSSEISPAVPVIAIDGPTASGKGTVAHRVAKALGWAVLDSGALYRLTALAALDRGLSASDEPGVARVAETLDVRFDGPHVYLEGREVGHDIRREEVGTFASCVAAFPRVRCSSASAPSACLRAWWRTGGTWARSCFRTLP